MTSELYNLSWNNFLTSTSNTFRNLLSDQYFCDVNKQVKAHKVILSACSPFFKNILIKNPHQHPLIYLKGISSEDFQAIIKFMYLGQVEFSHEYLNDFMSAAKELEVSGLADSENKEKKFSEDEWYAGEEKAWTQDKEESEHLNQKKTDEDFINSSYENEVTTMMTILEDEVLTTSSKSNFPCNKCEYQAKTKSNLNVHIRSKHLGVSYQCDVCQKSFTQRGNLNIHKDSVHEKKVYSCNVCEAKFSAPTNLSAHKSKYHKLT